MHAQTTPAEKVKAEMERRNLSARRLAAQIGVNKETILDFIHQRRKTHPSMQAFICRELGLDPNQTAPQAKAS